MRIFYTFIIVIAFSALNAQNTATQVDPINSLTVDILKHHISVLASDSLNGRFTSSEGQKKAARYIQTEFEAAGLHPYNDTCFYQPYSLWSWKWGECTLKSKHTSLTSQNDFLFLSNAPMDSTSAPCVFVGFGEDTIINDLDLKDKIAFAFTNSYSNYYSLAYRLKSRGVKAIILTNPNDEKAYQKISSRVDFDRVNVSKAKPFFSKTATKVFIVKPSFAKELFGKNIAVLKKVETSKEAAKISEKIIAVHCPVIVEKVKTENVAGYIKGKTNETIVLSAHYDHLGKKGDNIYYGADDNASGTTALLSLAKVIGEQKEVPDRNILFLATSGEELGLLGALHFADEQSKLPFDIKANLNIDMIGRNDSIGKSNYIYLIGSKEYPVLDSLCNIANQAVDLKIDYGYETNSSFGNLLNLSDHYAFHKQGIPVLGFFNGLHADYHKPTDTVDKIEFEEMLKRIRLIYYTSQLLVDKEVFNKN
nr:M20/M25/M40 family metallo-hydrolase [uncultured Carboxylicivirga sp.]